MGFDPADEWLRANDLDLAKSKRGFRGIRGPENHDIEGPKDEVLVRRPEDFDALLEVAVQRRTRREEPRAELVSVRQSLSTDRVCANPKCMKVFESSRSWNAYHSPECQQAARKRRDRNAYMREYRRRKRQQAA